MEEAEAEGQGVEDLGGRGEGRGERGEREGVGAAERE